LKSAAFGSNFFLKEQPEESYGPLGFHIENKDQGSLFGFNSHFMKDWFKSCPKTAVVDDLDINKYGGTWYELHRAKSSPGEGECAKALYTKKTETSIDVKNSAEKVDDQGHYLPRSGIEGEARRADPKATDGHLEVKFPQMPFWAPYEVLYTDYDTMAVVHSCVSFLGIYAWNQQWVILRKPINPSENPKEFNDLTTKATQILETQIPGFSFKDEMRHTHQGNDCSY